MNDEPRALARIISVRPNETYPDNFVVEVVCPYGCTDPHIHGIGTQRDGDGNYGTRTPHCGRWDLRDYIITDPDGITS